MYVPPPTRRFQNIFAVVRVLIAMYYSLAFIVASIISFRSLWVGKKNQAEKQEEDRKKIELMAMARQGRAQDQPATPENHSTWHKIQRSLLNTFADLEGTTLDRNDSSFLRVQVPSSQLTVDFSRWDGGTRGDSSTNIGLLTQNSRGN